MSDQRYGLPPQQPGQNYGPLGDYLQQRREERGEPGPHMAPSAWPAQPPVRAQKQYFQPPPGPYPQPPAYAPHRARPRRKRRVFLWVFLAIQALFVLWLVVGLATVHTGPTQAQLASACYHHNWWPVFKSQSDCVTHFGGALTDAGNAGKAIGAGLIIAFWAVVDIILGVSYGVYRLARRDR